MGDFVYREEYKYLYNACLNLTDACNLGCKYCFVEQNPHFMSYEIAQASVDFLLKNYNKQQELMGKTLKRPNLVFFGGEPTLCWDSIIVPLTTYIRNNHFPIALNMTTNGTLLNKERIKYLQNNGISILLSMDGDKITQDYNRPCRNVTQSSFDLVAANIPYILEYLPNTIFRSTIFAETAQFTFENFLFALNNGFKAIYFAVDERHPWTQEQINTLLLNIDKIFSFYDYCFANNIIIPIDFRQMTKSFENIKKSPKESTFSDSAHDIFRCGLGTTLGSIGYNGNIYGCQEQTSKTNKNIFLIGDIFTGINKEKHMKLLSLYKNGQTPVCTNEDLCKNCIRLCEKNCCPSTNLDMHNNFFIRSEIVCRYDKHIYENCMILLHKYQNLESNSFIQYLNKYCHYSVKKEA